MARKSSTKPYADTQLVTFLQRRLLELRPRKNQIDIAAEVGWKSRNMMAMIASGASMMPLERVPALAHALEVDSAFLLRLALDQRDTLLWAIIEEACGLVLTENEKKIITIVRELSRNSNPAPTSKLTRALREVFGE